MKHFLLSFFVMMVTLLTFISGTSAHGKVEYGFNIRPFELQTQKGKYIRY